MVSLTFGTFFAFAINKYDTIIQKVFYTLDNTTVQKITRFIGSLEKPIFFLYVLALIAMGYYGGLIDAVQTMGLTLGVSYMVIKACESPYNFAVKWLNEKNSPLEKVDNLIWHCNQHSNGQELFDWLDKSQDNSLLMSQVKSRFKDQPKFQEILSKWELRGKLQVKLATKAPTKRLKI